MSQAQESIDHLDRIIWRIRWLPFIPLVLLALVATWVWGTPGLLVGIGFAVIVSAILYLVRRPLVAKRLELATKESEEPQAGEPNSR
jgi:Flp pilus assembly protein TadB